MENKRVQVRIFACFFLFLFFVCVEGFVQFLHIVAKGPSAFPKQID